MLSPLRLLSALVLAASLSAAPAPAPKHDLWVLVGTSLNYTVGSTVLPISGVQRRGPDGKWTQLSGRTPNNVAFAVDPRDSRTYYTAALNGCWRTFDAGRTWRLTNGWEITEPRDVAVDLLAPDHVYLALPDGVAFSADRAQTWTRRESGLPDRGKYSQTIEPDRTRAGRLLVGCEAGIFLTEDHALAWRRVFASHGTVTDLRQSPHDPRHWLAATDSDGALASHDGGETWGKIPGVPAAAALSTVAFDPADPRHLAAGGWYAGLHVSTDAGRTWAVRTAGLPAPARLLRAAFDPDSGQLLAGLAGGGLFTSSDLGRTWRLAAFADASVSCLTFVPRPTP